MSDEPFYSRGGAENARYKELAAERYQWALECLQYARAWVDAAGDYCVPLSTGEPSPECAMQHIDDAIADVTMLIRRMED